MLKSGIKKSWIEALRSRKYEQGRGVMCNLKDDAIKFCCLGILCDIQDVPYSILNTYRLYVGRILEDESSDKIPYSLRQELGLAIIDQDKLIRMNDEGDSFHQIADWIEENL